MSRGALTAGAVFQGWLALSMAKYAMGNSSISQVQYRDSASTCTHVASTSASGEASSLQLSEGSAAEFAQQLRGFGGMVSPHVRDSQKYFVAALRAAIACANAQRQLQTHLHSQLGEDSGAKQRTGPASEGIQGGAGHAVSGTPPAGTFEATRGGGGARLIAQASVDDVGKDLQSAANAAGGASGA